MHVRGVKLKGFMAHDATEVALPDRGVVLVTGPNGAGKSGIVEGVATACWGKTLRGTSPWRDGQPGSVEAQLDDMRVTRAVTKGGKVALSWEPDTQDYPTVTKAQEALEAKLGSFDIWRRTHVFSSADAAHFTLATDGDRKRLLETILGLGKFDEALESCRLDLKASASKLADVGHVAAVATERAKGARARRDDAQAALDSLPPEEQEGGPAEALGGAPPPPPSLAAAEEKLTRLRESAAAVKADLAKLERARRGAAQACSDPKATLRAVEAQMTRLLRDDACPTCGQVIQEARRAQAQQQVEDARLAAAAAECNANAAVAEIDAQIADLTSELEDITAAGQKASQEVGAAREEAWRAQERAEEARRRAEERRRAKRARQEAQERADECVRALTAAEEAVARARADEVATGAQVAELQAVEQVLGLKGVRAHVLGRALGGMERVANRWLSLIAGPGLRLKMRPYSEKKTGGISDAISLDVSGAGGGFGYKASSGGERRRIDVALLLALAEVARAAHGSEPGSLFFDEVFDALDQDGVSAVADALADLSKDRAVVVITHSAALAEKLPCVAKALKFGA